MHYRLEIALDFNFFLVTNFCIWPSRSFINMKSPRNGNCFKNSRTFFSLIKACIIAATCVSCELCFLIDVRFDVRLCSVSIVVVFIALAFTLTRFKKAIRWRFLCYVTLLCFDCLFWKNGIEERWALLFRCQGKWK